MLGEREGEREKRKAFSFVIFMPMKYLSFVCLSNSSLSLNVNTFFFSYSLLFVNQGF